MARGGEATIQRVDSGIVHGVYGLFEVLFSGLERLPVARFQMESKEGTWSERHGRPRFFPRRELRHTEARLGRSLAGGSTA